MDSAPVVQKLACGCWVDAARYLEMCSPHQQGLQAQHFAALQAYERAYRANLPPRAREKVAA
jgi:hypothetical protein